MTTLDSTTQPTTASQHQMDAALAGLATTLLDPHQHTPNTAITALATGGSGLPAALTDGYSLPDLTALPPSDSPSEPTVASGEGRR